jgi:hypothetical protein
VFPSRVDEHPPQQRRTFLEGSVQPPERLVTLIERGMQFGNGGRWHVVALRLVPQLREKLSCVGQPSVERCLCSELRTELIGGGVNEAAAQLAD